MQMAGRKTGRKIYRRVINVILTIFAAVWIFPIIYTILGCFKGKQEYNLGNFWDFPAGNMIAENFAYIQENADILSGVMNSLLYAACGAVFSVVIALLAAYAITHLKIKNRMFWFMFIYCGTIFPFQIYLIPVFKGYNAVGLYNTRLGIILFYTAICIPFAMFVLRNFFNGVSGEILESAKIDGASDFQILWKILVPMATAPISVVFLSQFTWCWNDLMFGLTFTKSNAIRTVMSAVSLMGTVHVPALLLACVIASAPTILLFVFMQKNFESGFVYQSK